MAGPPSPRRPAVRAVVFDMDGVLFEGRNFWMDLHLRLGGREAEVNALLDRYLATDYDALAEAVVGRLWRGKSAAAYYRLAKDRRYQRGVVETVLALKATGIKTAIVSSGPDLLAARAQDDLDIDLVRANGIEVVDGLITGRSTIQVPDGEKGRIAAEALAQLGVDWSEAAVVGDTASDVPLLRRAAMPIAYDSSSEELSATTPYNFRHGDFGRILGLIGGSALA
jgi:phosphoserine phosphatase